MTEIDYVKIFKALSDEMRLKILQEIAKHEEICVCKLMEKFANKIVIFILSFKIIVRSEFNKSKTAGKMEFL